MSIRKTVALTLIALTQISPAFASDSTYVGKNASRYDGMSVVETKRRQIKLHITNGKLGDVFKMVSKITGISYVLENDVGVEEVQTAGGMMRQSPTGEQIIKSDIYDIPTTVSYKGYSVEDLINQIGLAADVSCQEDMYGVWHISRYETYTAKLPISFDMAVSGGGSLTLSGGADNNQQQQTTAGSESNMSYSYTDSDFVGQIKAMLSGEGKVVRSSAGFITIIDRPSRLRKIKKVLQQQQMYSEPFRLNIKVVRVDYNRGRENGINWNYVLGNGNNLQIAANYANPVDNAFSFTIQNTRLSNVLKLLSTYGNVKVVKEWTVTARGGHPIFFDDVEQIPWATTSAITTDTSTEVADEVNFSSVGLKIRLIANAFDENITGDVYAEISDLLGIEQVTNSTRAPHSSASRVALSYSVPFNQSVIVSGLTARKKEASMEGLPLISKIPVIGNLFKHESKSEKKQDFIVIITPTPLQ